MAELQEGAGKIDQGERSRGPVRRFLRKALRNWRERHQLPFNFVIHLFGIPLAVAGVVLLFFLPWYWGVAGIVLGYLLQYIGHAVEGNDVGEWAGIKRMLGLPYVGIAPRWQQPGTASK
ncbi:MAG TPA: Mpo1-like protein [Gemmataceae bacterium]|nr:Mpo1-like protein [Gemmataceae bacterium]